MQCPTCQKDMRLTSQDTSHNFDTGTEYTRSYYVCDANDVWATIEAPKSPKTAEAITYKPSFALGRTPEEKRDMFKAWARDDRAFFADGACHILAYLFVQLHQHEGYRMVYLKPAEGFVGNHVYASNGEWVFDHNGWMKEKELLALTEKVYMEKYPEWHYERIPIENSMTVLEDFCRANLHRLPWQFAYLPWERAYRYIKRFSDMPPGADRSSAA